MPESLPEVWLRGPVEGVPPLLQPVAHALLQASEEVEAIAGELTQEQLWARPAGVASAGFHIQHIAGVVDRLFTYAREQALSERQRVALAAEGRPISGTSATELAAHFRTQVEDALTHLRSIDGNLLTEPRTVGRKQLPSTVMGLLFHAAEHVQRHVGQLLVTTRVVREGR